MTPNRDRSNFGPLVVVLATLLLDSVGVGIIVPTLPRLLEQIAGRGAAEIADTFGLLLMTYLGMVFLFAPLLGRLSDRFGRRPVMLLSLGGTVVVYVIQAMASSLWMLFAARAIGGLCGANAVAAGAYIADITPPERRAQSFGLIAAASGTGLMIGPAIGGLLGGIDLRLPFYAAAGLSAVTFLFGLVVLRESLEREKRRRFDWRVATPLSSLPWLARCSPLVRGLAIASLIEEFALNIAQAPTVLFMQLRLGWDGSQIGLWLTINGLCAALGQALLIRPVTGALGDRGALLLGMTASIFVMAAAGFIDRGWQAYVVAGVSMIGVIIAPAAQAIVSREVPGNQMGELRGAMGSMGALLAMLGAPLGSSIFGFFTSPAAPVALPGAAFFSAGLVMIPAVVCAAITLRSNRGIGSVEPASSLPGKPATLP